ncbi:hypothetical protein EYF80_054089 [Liparis tanakae]|uniref:Uncharacterized protein n=1 Tax=Liparis tanakae TaxID=230148 RepID=A0A4Z2F3E2_9TELE|nr:hypothetical protein EYF80_054089 [Liparis tanakae]
MLFKISVNLTPLTRITGDKESNVLIVVFSVCPHGSSHVSIGSSSKYFHPVDWAQFSGSTLR